MWNRTCTACRICIRVQSLSVFLAQNQDTFTQKSSLRWQLNVIEVLPKGKNSLKQRDEQQKETIFKEIICYKKKQRNPVPTVNGNRQLAPTCDVRSLKENFKRNPNGKPMSIIYDCCYASHLASGSGQQPRSGVQDHLQTAISSADICS